MIFYFQEYFIVNQLNICWFMVALCYVTVRQNIVQPGKASDNKLESSLSPHPPLKPGTCHTSHFEPKGKIRLRWSTYKVTSYVNFTQYLGSLRTFLLLFPSIQNRYVKSFVCGRLLQILIRFSFFISDQNPITKWFMWAQFHMSADSDAHIWEIKDWNTHT